ncbi:MAG: hypothetical protein NVS2B12_36110 [Ktedonobacteraceae bacterium]
MKQEVTNNITTLLVEAGDERAHVLNVLTALAQCTGQRVIVVLPVDAVFRRPSDLRELEQAASRAGVGLILVIANNEGLRLWARRQGFTVFSTLESCAKAQLPAALTLPGTSGQFKVPGVPIARQSPRITEPLHTRHVAPRVPASTAEYSWWDLVDTSIDTSIDTPAAVSLSGLQAAELQLIDVQKALEKQIAEEKAQDQRVQPLSLLTDAVQMPGMVAGQASEPASDLVTVQLLRTGRRTIWYDRLLFVLVALLVLGIVGGVGFAYLLSAAHGVPGTFSLTSLTHSARSIYQAVH